MVVSFLPQQHSCRAGSCQGRGEPQYSQNLPVLAPPQAGHVQGPAAGMSCAASRMMMFSSGAGANGNSSLGTGVVGGMLVGTLALLFVVPVFYIIFEFLQEKIRPPMEEEADVQVLLEKEKSEAERNNK